MSAAAALLLAALAAGPGDPALGERIYLDGAAASGEPLRAVVAGGTVVTGKSFACASCHRRSGFGSIEGGAYVPPVTGPALFGTRPQDRAELFRRLYQEVQPATATAQARDPRVRPPYTAATLAAALREGRDPSGRLLAAWMPRYEIGDEDMAHLVAYLERLAAAPDPGVDDTVIHFATITTDDVAPARSRAMLAVARAYVERKNADTRGLLARPGHSPLHRDDFVGAYREWVLDEWHLTGPSGTWRAQLEDAYRERNVFAVLGGIGAGSWQPVHDFCESHHVPCLFPQTELPVQEPGAYSLYLSRGVAGEAAALARFLRETREDELDVVQVHDGGQEGRAAAQAFAAAVEGVDGLRLEERSSPEGPEPDAWVLWTASLAASPPDGEAPVYLSTTLLGTAEVPPAWRPRARLVYPYALPGREVARIYRVRAWLRSRGIEDAEERVQLNTFFAFSVAEHALDHLVERFSRDYFVEEVEHETENALNPGVYPRLALGPGQRFASKGSYVVALGASGEVEALGSWIVPGN